jgi:putative Ca2+/H+ antiporter (TMEM165/GDT1 family)
MFSEYIQALFFIFAAEMGDKTQILAMMFATKYKLSKVLIGIALGSLLNHGLAVLFGSLLGQLIPIYVLQMIAGMAFIGFALWTLMDSKDEDSDIEQSSKKEMGPIILVAMAFFIWELGDKTQLTAITLAVDATYPAIILLGTVSGMLVTSGIGIFVGRKIGDRLPEALIKVVSSAIFLTFGIIKLVTATPSAYVTMMTVIPFGVIVMVAVGLLLRSTIKAHRSGHLTPYSKAARALYTYAHELEQSVDEICRGVKHCGQCRGEQCAIGFIRHLVKEIKANDYQHDHAAMVKEIRFHQGKFDEHKLYYALTTNVKYLNSLKANNPGFEEVNLMRDVLEILLIDESLPYETLIDQETYFRLIRTKMKST